MEVLILSCLILFGALLVMAEVIFIPGTTLVGLLGLLLTGLGVYYAYQEFSSATALWVFLGTVVVNSGFLVFGFKSGVWDKFSLKDTVSARTFDDRLEGLEVGQEGITRSDCKPYGKVMFGDKIYEVKSEGGFIPTNKTVYIYKLDHNLIIVRQ